MSETGFSLVDELRRKASERRALAECAAGSEAQALFEEAREFEELARTVQLQERATPVAPLIPVKPRIRWKFR